MAMVPYPGLSRPTIVGQPTLDPPNNSPEYCALIWTTTLGDRMGVPMVSDTHPYHNKVPKHFTWMKHGY